MDPRLFAARLIVNILRGGEMTAAKRFKALCAADVVLICGSGEISGADAVAAALGGQRPMTDAFARGIWSAPRLDGAMVRIDATFDLVGASPDRVALEIAFDARGSVAKIVQKVTPFTPAPPGAAMPAIVRNLVDRALANGTPMAFACVGEEGAPLLSVRGSIQALDERRLSLWVRRADGSAARAIRANPRVSLLYRDSRARTTLVFEGTADIVDDPDLAGRIFDLLPEVEQTHDPMRQGIAVIVDVTRLSGFTPAGQVRMECGG